MELFETLKTVYAQHHRPVMLTDSELLPVWDNGRGVPGNYSVRNIRLQGDLPVELPITKAQTARYGAEFGKAQAMEITPLGNDEEPDGYLIQFYGCIDVQELCDVSDYFRYRAKYLGNITDRIQRMLTAFLLYRKNHPELTGKAFDEFEADIEFHMARIHAATVNMLVLAKHNNGVYPKQGISLSDVVDSVCQSAQELFDKAGCVFTYKITPYVCLLSNADTLRAAVTNLLVNAFKYCRAPKRKIRLELFKDKRGTVISVMDNGGGEFKEKLESYRTPFEAFVCYDENESLGISVAQSYCKLMGGELIYTTEKDRFTKAEMIIPDLPENTMLLKIDEKPYFKDIFDLEASIFSKAFDMGRKTVALDE